jgi:hypothetical protein
VGDALESIGNRQLTTGNWQLAGRTGLKFESTFNRQLVNDLNVGFEEVPPFIRSFLIQEEPYKGRAFDDWNYFLKSITNKYFPPNVNVGSRLNVTPVATSYALVKSFMRSENLERSIVDASLFVFITHITV